MSERKFKFAFNGMTLESQDKYFVDKYGNRYMLFSDGNGNKFKIKRDDLIIDMGTGECRQRHKEMDIIEA